MRRLLAAALVMTTATSARADSEPITHKAIGDGYELVVGEQGAFVMRGKQRARLADGLSIERVTFDKKGKKVGVVLADVSCAGTSSYSWTLGHLDARLENTAAYALHRKQDYRGSAAGFAKAVIADPTWKVPAYNLASAQQLLGDADAAMKTLTPWLSSEPVATYLKVTTDPELAPLLERAELKALRAKQPGDISFTQTQVDGHVAYQPEKKLIAVTRTESSWGSCSYQTDLEIYDVRTAALIAKTPLVEWSQTSTECEQSSGVLLPRARKSVQKRVAALAAMLRDLGFRKVKTEEGTAPKREASEPVASSVKTQGLRVVAQDGTVRVFKKNTELGSGRAFDRLQSVVSVPDLNMVVVWSLRAGAEGCEGSDPTQVTLVPLSGAASK